MPILVPQHYLNGHQKTSHSLVVNWYALHGIDRLTIDSDTDLLSILINFGAQACQSNG